MNGAKSPNLSAASSKLVTPLTSLATIIAASPKGRFSASDSARWYGKKGDAMSRNAERTAPRTVSSSSPSSPAAAGSRTFLVLASLPPPSSLVAADPSFQASIRS
jgi:hypothetical protein